MDEQAKRAWVGRVLQVELDSPAQGGSKPGPLLPIWIAAKDAVDSNLSSLQSSLRGFRDPDLDRIAEFGLNGVTGRASVGLMTALREADRASPPEPKARLALTNAIASYRSFLDGDPAVQLIDDNPFGISVGLHATLGRALDELDRANAA